jgi:hypothetical protein
MADLPNPPVITTDGDYDVTVSAGREYLVTVAGTWNGATVTLYAYDHGLEDFVAVEDAAWTANAELRYVPRASRLRLTLTNDGASTSLSVTRPRHRRRGDDGRAEASVLPSSRAGRR